MLIDNPLPRLQPGIKLVQSSFRHPQQRPPDLLLSILQIIHNLLQLQVILVLIRSECIHQLPLLQVECEYLRLALVQEHQVALIIVQQQVGWSHIVPLEVLDDGEGHLLDEPSVGTGDFLLSALVYLDNGAV